MLRQRAVVDAMTESVATDSAAQQGESAHLELLHELSEEQYAAATSEAAATLVLAGAGTGKTRTLIARLGYLHSIGYFNEARVLMLAFAKKAAQEMAERIEQLLPSVSEAVDVSTFHSLGLQIVARVTGRMPRLTELSEADAMSHFIRQGFFELCARDSAYLKAYYKWLNLSSLDNLAAQSLRTLNDEYTHHRGEWICANVLYQLNIDYFYQPLYARPHHWTKYQCYRPSFYLVNEGIYLEVYEVAEQALSALQLAHRQRVSTLHAAQGSTLIELFVDESLADFYAHCLRLLSLLKKPARHQRRPRAKSLRLGRSAYHYEHLVAQLCRWLPLFKHQQSWPDLSQSPLADGHLLNALLAPLWQRYQAHLADTGTIDYERMISLASDYVRSGAFKVPWSEVMIDEFQDISAERAALIQAMREQKPSLRLFCVGDDWQAIYRFAGSNLRFTTDFEHYFGEVRRYALSQTFRFGECLSRESSRFVLQNPLQSRKALYGQAGHQQPLVLCCTKGLTEGALLATIFELIQRDAAGRLTGGAQERSTVLLLSRFHHFLPTTKTMQAWSRQFPKLALLQGTVHGVKGNEADYVVLLAMNQGEFGFPSTKQSDALVEYHLPPPEDFPYAEERRLFYVALTRARQQVYLIYDEDNASVFIEELKRDYPVLHLKELMQQAALLKKPRKKAWQRLNIFKVR